MINNVGGVGGIQNYKKIAEEKQEVQGKQGTKGKEGTSNHGAQVSEAAKGKNMDSFVKSKEGSEADNPVTYAKPKTDYSAQVQALKDEQARQIEDFKKMIMDMIHGQAGKGSGSGFSASSVNIKIEINISNVSVDGVSDDTSFDNDSQWGVDAVATRIMDFAKNLAGGDPSKIQMLQDAVVEGFKQAGFDPDNRDGCGMPGITGRTFDEIMNRFADWKKEAGIES